METRKDESGMVIIEATIVFPIMIIVILTMIFLGNLYIQKCKVNYAVTSTVIKGATFCADPILDDVMNNTLDLKTMDILPYRYVLANKGSIESKLKNEINEKIDLIDTGLIFDMKPSVKEVNVKFNNAVVYSTLSANVKYKIELPIKMIGEKERFGATMSFNIEIPVSDSVEFMRNIDMVEDYMQRSKTVDKLKKAMSKALEWMH